MRVHITISFDEEIPISQTEPWPEALIYWKDEIQSDIATYLNKALPTLNGELNIHQRGPFRVTINPR